MNYAGLLLMLFGLLLLMLEVKVTSYGLLTAGGLASLLFGSMILMDSLGARAPVEPAARLAGRPRARRHRRLSRTARPSRPSGASRSPASRA